MLSNSLLKATPQVRHVLARARQMSVISGPPTHKGSPIVKAVHGLAIVFSLLAVPAWVSCNIRNYNAEH